MPKPFNKQLHKDILLLKKIAHAKGTPGYKKVFSGIMQFHGISKSTIYNELAKEVPGSYKDYESKGRTVEISPREIDTVRELLKAGKTIDFIKNHMSIELGFSYSDIRLNKVKYILNSYGKPLDPLILNEDETEIDRTGPGQTPADPEPAEPVKFKGNIRKFFYRLSHVEKISKDRTIRIDMEGNVFPVNKAMVKSFFDMLAASGETGGKSKGEIFRFNMETILLNESDMYRRGVYIAPGGVKQLESVRKSLAETSPDNEKNHSKGGYNLDDIHMAVRHFSPNTTREDVVRFLKSRSIK